MISASNELIELSGKKTNRRIYMVPMPANMIWDEYLCEIKRIEADMACANVVVTINKTDSIATTTNSPYRRFTFTLVDENGVVTTKSAPYIVTLDGYKFYSSVANFASVKVSPDGGAFTSQTLDVTLEAVNATTAWYTIGADAPDNIVKCES